MAKLINGNGNPAIYAAEDADLIASLAGNVTCIANVGNKYAATEEDATTIRLDDGVIVTKEGRRIQLEAGESDTFYIPTGTSGVTNYYIIGYKLVQNADSTQVAEQFVQKMNSSTETITEDTFRGGATEVYVSLYRVTQVGFTISSITGLLPELLDSNAAKDDIAQINSNLGDLNTELADTLKMEAIVENFYMPVAGTWTAVSNQEYDVSAYKWIGAKIHHPDVSVASSPFNFVTTNDFKNSSPSRSFFAFVDENALISLNGDSSKAVLVGYENATHEILYYRGSSINANVRLTIVGIK